MTQTGGKDTKQIDIVIMVAAVLAVLLMAGCTSSPEKGASNASTEINDEIAADQKAYEEKEAKDLGAQEKIKESRLSLNKSS